MKNVKWKMENGLTLIHLSQFNGGVATECHPYSIADVKATEQASAIN